jgi:signal transduction histidine kinase
MTGLLQIPPIELSTFWQINPFKEGQQWRRNLFIWTKSGREVEITLSISGLFDRQGRLVEYIATMRDITLRQQLEKAQQQFMSSISHEVRTPLTNLILYMRLIRQHPERTAYLDVLDQQIERLQTLMTGVIEISDLTLSKGTTSWQMVPLPLVLRSATEGNRERAHSRNIRFEVGPLPADLPVVNGDPIRLSQALGELIKNAVEFTPEGGQVTIEIKVIEVKKLPWVTIAVRDTGPGISLEEQEHIFGNFFRGEEAERNNIPGAGLGLPMAQAIVKAHGGQVVVESEPGQGSTFTLWLPTPQALLASISR